MESRIPFSEVVDLLEANGWELTRIWNPYRVFTKLGATNSRFSSKFTTGW